MDPDRLAALRRRYDRLPMLEGELGPDPFAAFAQWFAEAATDAEEGLLVEANAVILATADPHVALVFPWHPLDRQVRVTGRAEKVSREETEAYFRTRPWSSRIGAWASHQSSVLRDRKALEDRFAELAHRWPEGSDVPVPDFWGGLRVVPDSVEFWQGRPDRLHDRLRFSRELAPVGDPGEHPGAWVLERLAP